MPRHVRVIRYDEKAETPQLNWAKELASYGINLRPEKPVEQLTLNEVAGKIITENKPLTLKRALELGAAAGCSTMPEIYAAVPGSYASHIKAIDAALAQSVPKGISVQMSADVRISACIGDMPKQVLLKVWEPVKDGHKTTYYMCPVGLDKDGNIEFGDAVEVDVSAQFSPVDISKHQNSQSKTERDKIRDIEQQHERKLERDQAFFDSVKMKQDRAEKRERLPRLTGTLTGTEFMTGVSNAVEAKPSTSIEIGKCLSELARGTKRISDLTTEQFSEVYAIAQNHAETVADGKIVAACDSALISEKIIVGANGKPFFIPSAVLKSAVETAKTEMAQQGGFFVYAEHQFDLKGGEDPSRAVALVKAIEFDEKTLAVKLPRIEFLADSEGAKTLIETARQGKRYGISARFQKGAATVHRSGLDAQNETHEYKSLRILGFDIVTRPGIKDAELYWL